MARGFIGVNKIVTTSSIGDIKLPKSKVFSGCCRKNKKEISSRSSYQ